MIASGKRAVGADLDGPAVGQELAAGVLARAPRGAVTFVLARVAPGARAMVSGMTIPEGAGSRRILVRAAGRGLAALGVGDALKDPALTIFESRGPSVQIGRAHV